MHNADYARERSDLLGKVLGAFPGHTLCKSAPWHKKLIEQQVSAARLQFTLSILELKVKKRIGLDAVQPAAAIVPHPAFVFTEACSRLIKDGKPL